MQAQEDTFVAGHLFMCAGVNGLLAAINSRRIPRGGLARSSCRAVNVALRLSASSTEPVPAATDSSGKECSLLSRIVAEESERRERERKSETPEITRVAPGCFSHADIADIFEKLASPTFTDSNAVEVDVLRRIFRVLPPASLRGIRASDNGFSLAKHVFAVRLFVTLPSPIPT